MKYFILVALLVSGRAHAGIFQQDTILPLQLQAKVMVAVKARCLSSLFSFKELSTRLSMEEGDKGQTHSYYSTLLTAEHYFDGMHPVSVIIEVESAEYAISNPAGVGRAEVLSVKADEDICR